MVVDNLKILWKCVFSVSSKNVATTHIEIYHRDLIRLDRYSV